MTQGDQSGEQDRVLLVGAGRMGGAMIEGWLAQGVAGSRIAAIDPHPSDHLRMLATSRGIALNPLEPVPAETLILAVKPQMFADVAGPIEPLAGPDTTIVSIMAGRSLADLTRHFPRAAGHVRAMPNLPAAVGRGMTGVVAGAALSDGVRARITRWLGAVGQVEWLTEEREIDVVTALSGSGPAYAFLLAEVLARAGERLGLAPDLAGRIGRATVEGAGELLFRTPELTPAALRRNVTSPGGTTAAALAVLTEEDALARLVEAAVEAAFRRAQELSGAS